MKVIISVLAIVCGVAFVTSTPILPTHPLGEMDYVDACLFLCNICFDGNDELMMTCANRVCLSEYPVNEYSMYIIKQLCPKNSNLGRLSRASTKLKA